MTKAGESLDLCFVEDLEEVVFFLFLAIFDEVDLAIFIELFRNSKNEIEYMNRIKKFKKNIPTTFFP